VHCVFPAFCIRQVFNCDFLGAGGKVAITLSSSTSSCIDGLAVCTVLTQPQHIGETNWTSGLLLSIGPWDPFPHATRLAMQDARFLQNACSRDQIGVSCNIAHLNGELS
jgi:hypothetical protein